MATQLKNAPARRVRTPKAKQSSRPTLTEVSPTHTDRTRDGRFAAGNVGGPGNPHARHCARMLALLRASISDEEMVAIIRKLVEKARAGDVSAAKLLMSYKLGKPAPAPNPDEIDRDEWEHYQRDTINLEEVQQVLGSLPAKVGNDIAPPDGTQAQEHSRVNWPTTCLLGTNPRRNQRLRIKWLKKTLTANGHSWSKQDAVSTRAAQRAGEGSSPAGR